MLALNLSILTIYFLNLFLIIRIKLSLWKTRLLYASLQHPLQVQTLRRGCQTQTHFRSACESCLYHAVFIYSQLSEALTTCKVAKALLRSFTFFIERSSNLQTKWAQSVGLFLFYLSRCLTLMFFSLIILFRRWSWRWRCWSWRTSWSRRAFSRKFWSWRKRWIFFQSWWRPRW